LRQALANADAGELTLLAAHLEPVAEADGNVASWLLVLLVDEMMRRHGMPAEPGPGESAQV
jgi:hypothetical protein